MFACVKLHNFQSTHLCHPEFCIRMVSGRCASFPSMALRRTRNSQRLGGIKKKKSTKKPSRKSKGPNPAMPPPFRKFRAFIRRGVAFGWVGHLDFHETKQA